MEKLDELKYRKRVILEMSRYPMSCSECPAFHQEEYRCHNEHGMSGSCDLGYTVGCDMRDFRGERRHCGYAIMNNPNVKIVTGKSL